MKSLVLIFLAANIDIIYKIIRILIRILKTKIFNQILAEISYFVIKTHKISILLLDF